MNLAILRGNLTKDPEIRVTSGGVQVCKFGLAVNEFYGGKKKAHFFDCTAFGKVAENLVKYKKTGDEIIVQGRLDHQRWKANDGTNRSKIEVIASSVEYIGGGKKKSEQEDSSPEGAPPDDEFDGPNEEIPF